MDLGKLSFFILLLLTVRQVRSQSIDDVELFSREELDAIKEFMAIQSQEADQISTDPSFDSKRELPDFIVNSAQVASGPVIRKEFRMMTDRERRSFFAAAQQLAQRDSGGSRPIDAFALQHIDNFATAHRGAAFLPWHREFVKSFENGLQSIDSSVAVPYWASHLDALLPEPLDSIMWTDRFAGPSNGPLNSGPFANFLNIQGNVLRRAAASSGGGRLPTLNRINFITSRRSFKDQVTCHSPITEGTHDLVHMWLGGDMTLAHAPNDPLFYLHHAFWDYLWEESRKLNPDAENDYVLPRDDPCRSGHNSYDNMFPFENMRNMDGLSRKYTVEEYTYEQVPTCSERNNDCGGSPYMFCHSQYGLCLPKVKASGNCTGLERFDSCFSEFSRASRCINGRCSEERNPVTSPGAITTRRTPTTRATSTTRRTTSTTRRTTSTTRRTTSTTRRTTTSTTRRITMTTRQRGTSREAANQVSRDTICAQPSSNRNCALCCSFLWNEEQYERAFPNRIPGLRRNCALCTDELNGIRTTSVTTRQTPTPRTVETPRTTQRTTRNILVTTQPSNTFRRDRACTRLSDKACSDCCSFLWYEEFYRTNLPHTVPQMQGQCNICDNFFQTTTTTSTTTVSRSEERSSGDGASDSPDMFHPTNIVRVCEKVLDWSVCNTCCNYGRNKNYFDTTFPGLTSMFVQRCTTCYSYIQRSAGIL